MANRIVFALFLAVGLFLVINFSSRITAGQPLQEAFLRAQQEIEQLNDEQTALLAERDYVRSDAFVERWARDDGKMVRPGEVLVIPVPSRTSLGENAEDTAAALAVAVETTPRSAQPWTVWWALFFDTPPPDIN
jgi:cell division protein FtsB